MLIIFWESVGYTYPKNIIYVCVSFSAVNNDLELPENLLRKNWLSIKKKFSTQLLLVIYICKIFEYLEVIEHSDKSNVLRYWYYSFV